MSGLPAALARRGPPSEGAAETQKPECVAEAAALGAGSAAPKLAPAGGQAWQTETRHGMRDR
eukprot:5565305-Alexandrium_andersonii.AAC.1